MTPGDAAKFLDLIAEHAAVLRERGVRRVELDGVVFVLVGPEPEVARAPDPRPDVEPEPDALHDPWTHGGPPAPGAPRRLPKRERTPLVGRDE